MADKFYKIRPFGCFSISVLDFDFIIAVKSDAFITFPLNNISLTSFKTYRIVSLRIA